MRAWFRRNTVALVVILLAAPALVGVQLGLPLLENAQTDDPVIEVALGETVTAAGYEWTLLANDRFDNSEGNDAIPDGLELVAAIVGVKATGTVDGASCDAVLVSADHGWGDHSWDELSSPSTFGYELYDDATTICLLDGDSFDYESVFLAPLGTARSAALEIRLMSGTVLRFELS